MLKRIIVFLLCLILANLVSFYKMLDNSYRWVEEFKEYVNEHCINYENLDEVRVVFNYDNIDYFLEKSDYKTKKEELSKTSFIIIIEVKNGVFYKTIKEEFLIRKGDMYDDGN